MFYLKKYYSFRKNNNQSLTILEVHVKDQGAGSIYIGLTWAQSYDSRGVIYFNVR